MLGFIGWALLAVTRFNVGDMFGGILCGVMAIFCL